MIYVMQIVNTHGIRGEVKALHFTDGEVFFKKVKTVYFKETNAQNMIFENIHASDKLTAVFGGNGNVKMKATNIVRESESVPIFDSDLTVAKMKTDEF